LIRGQRVMLDSDLAAIYQVSTKRLNQQLRRNRSRFPVDFAFQITAEELTNLKSQIATSSLRLQTATSKKRGGRRYLPWVFTEHAAMWEGPQGRDQASLKSIGALRPLPHF
jgi:hypothetical protein